MRLIDADALIEAYDRAHEGEPGKARQLILDAPTIEERKTGKWVHLGGNEWCCDKCGFLIRGSWKHPHDFGANYCLKCGAKMEG